MKRIDNFNFNGKIPQKDVDYVETDDTFTILNVPILAEMVQHYDNGWAFKQKDEILNVEVNNVPLTIVDYAPTHPKHISELNTFEKKDVVVGFMSEPSNPKDSMSKTKRYADFVLYNTPKIKALKDVYLSGSYIDTSIGFRCMEDRSCPGEFAGMKYDYIQRGITLDHNAILIDRQGNLGVGRMPSPIGGIGADSNTEDKKMSEELKKQIDSLSQENKELRKELDEAKKADVQEKVDSLQSELEKAKQDSDKVSVELKDAKDELVKLKDELKVYKDAEAEELKNKVDALKEHYPETAELFEKADAEYIEKKYSEIVDKKQESSSKDLGADMMRTQITKGKSEAPRFARYSGKKEEGDN